MSGLPEGWTNTGLLEIATLLRGVTYTKGDASDSPFSGSVPVLRANNIQGEKFDFSDLVHVPRDLVADSQLIRAGDVVVATSSGSISVVGKAAQARSKIEAGFGAFCGLLRPSSEVEPRYFGHYFSSAGYRSNVSEMARGVNINNLKREHFESLQIPLAPLPEQKRIADKLDTLLARVDACREHLDRVPAILKRFRQSVLAAATSGELTREWREENSIDRGQWRQTTFDNVCKEITVGFVGKMSDQYRTSGVPFLRSQNVRPFRFDPRGLLHISRDFHQTIAKSTLRPGDVAVVRTGAPGQCCVIPPDLTEANCSDLVIVRPGIELDSNFAVVFINSETSQSFVKSERVGVAQSHFNVGSMKRAPVDLPPLPEQKEIARRVDELFAWATELEARLNAAHRITSGLSGSTLAKAFRGDLVPQDPNDEPAAALLARIAAQRDDAGASSAPRRGRKATASGPRA